jgi:hypothetical protein
VSAHHFLLLYGRIVGGLLLVIFGVPSVLSLVARFQRSKKYRHYWSLRRKWREAVAVYMDVAQLTCAGLLLAGRYVWLGLFGLALMGLLIITIPCGTPKYNRPEWKVKRALVLLLCTALCIAMGAGALIIDY